MKKLGIVALSSLISISALGANNKIPNTHCNNPSPKIQIYDSFVYSTHHSQEEIPSTFVGSYSKRVHLGNDHFTIDKIGHLKGHFKERGKNGKLWDMNFNGVVVAMGTNNEGKKRLMIRYVISRTNLKNLSKKELSAIDVSGTLFLNEPYNGHAHDMIVGSFGNYIYINDMFNFKAG